MENKLCHSIRDAVIASGLKDGMTITFNHCLRNGDKVVAAVMKEIHELGIRDIKINISGMMNGMMEAGLVEMVKDETITSVTLTGNTDILGRMISTGQVKDPCTFVTHGGRPRAISAGETHIDVDFVAASTADCMGNCNGVEGPNAFGSIGYSMTTSRYADKVVVITDNLVPYPLQRVSIDETVVDYVVKVDAIGDPNLIATGIAKPTKDPLALLIADYAAKTIQASGLLKDGFVYQAGAGGPSIATTKNLLKYMDEGHIHGSHVIGGITGTSVDLLEGGYFDSILDVQCFDRKAAESLLKDPLRHREISDICYATPGGLRGGRSCAVDQLDVVILGALEVDLDFNCNVTVNSAGYVTGGAGGHSDTAAGAKLAMITVPLRRTRFPSIMKKCTSITTPGKDIDVVVTEYGVAVNPKHKDLPYQLKQNGVKVMSIEELQKKAEELTGAPRQVKFGDKLVGNVVDRYGNIIDRIYNVIED